jgi:hypothetical protein
MKKGRIFDFEIRLYVWLFIVRLQFQISRMSSPTAFLALNICRLPSKMRNLSIETFVIKLNEIFIRNKFAERLAAIKG